MRPYPVVGLALSVLTLSCAPSGGTETMSLLGTWDATSIEASDEDGTEDWMAEGGGYTLTFSGTDTRGTVSSERTLFGEEQSGSSGWAVVGDTLTMEGWDQDEDEICTFTPPNGTTTITCESSRSGAVLVFARR